MTTYNEKYFENLAAQLSANQQIDPFSFVKEVWDNFCIERCLNDLDEIANGNSDTSKLPKFDVFRDPVFDPDFHQWMLWGVRHLLACTSYTHEEIIQYFGLIEKEISDNVLKINQLLNRDPLSSKTIGSTVAK